MIQGRVACAAALALLLLTMPAAAASGGADVTTFHGDNLRTGWQSAEAALTPQSVASGAFGRVWTSPQLDGDLYGQPLYVHGVTVGGAPHDVVFVATEADSVWALDAHSGAVLWGPVSLGSPVPQSALPCGNIDPVGITGTPVIDVQRGLLYAVALTSADGGSTLQYVLAALSLSTGAEQPGWPVPLSPPPGANGQSFDPRVQEQRGALTLLPGGSVLDIPFGGYYGDCGDYHGWVVQVWLPNPQDQAGYATPSNREAGLWAAGGLAYGPEGALFGVTGNSDGSAAGDMGNSVIRLLPTPHLRQPAGAAGFFAPSNALPLDDADLDLGSAGPLLLPPQPGPYPYLLFAAGKQGVGYLVDRWYPGGVGTGDGVSGEAVFSTCLFGGCGSQEAVFSTAAYFAAADGGQYVLVAGRTAQRAPCGGSGGLEAWRLTTGTDVWQPHLDLAWCGPTMSDPGAPTVSSNGARDGIAWVVDAGSARLLAVDAADGSLLQRQPLPGTHRFIAPTVAGGMVYVAARQAVVAFGLR